MGWKRFEENGIAYAHLQSWHIMRFTRKDRRLVGVHLLPTYRRRQHTVDMMKDKSSFVGIDHGIDSFNINVETYEEEGSTGNYGIVTPTLESSGLWCSG